jgi:hypothetical protein
MGFPDANRNRPREGRGQDDENRQGAEQGQDDRRENKRQQDQAERQGPGARHARLDECDPDSALAHGLQTLFFSLIAPRQPPVNSFGPGSTPPLEQSGDFPYNGFAPGA